MTGRWPALVLDLPGTDRMGQREWWVYLHRDADGNVIYVGSTQHPRNRNKEHVRSSAWWGDVDRIDLIGPWDDDATARDYEAHLIRKIQPAHNVIHTERNHRPLTVAEARERVRVAEIALAIAREALAAAEHRELVSA